MQGLSKKQTYVLSHIEWVFPLPRKLKAKSPFSRYQLDGTECTAQITLLCDRKLIVVAADGSLRRSRAAGPRKAVHVGPRQAPLLSTVEDMKALLLEPIN